MRELFVWRVGRGSPILVGRIAASPIAFTYDEGYLSSDGARPISLSLPLRAEPYEADAMQPYFEGLLPEGESRDALAMALSVDSGDFLELLSRCGREIIGDVALTESEEPLVQGEYKPVSLDEMRAMFADLSSMANANNASRLSLAGTQGKVGLAHMPGCSLGEGWCQPLGGAASTHVLKTSSLRDVPYLEHLCAIGARACGIDVPEVALLDLGRPVFCIERFDRRVEGGTALHVHRLHQEDAAQAFGIRPRSKYLELNPSTAAVLADLLRSESQNPIADLEQFVKTVCFNYLVGNCDNHLKNVSFIYGEAWRGFRLAPSYDLVSTTRYDRFSRDMGMRIGTTRAIDDIVEDDFLKLADEVGIHRDQAREICGLVAEAGHRAIAEAADSASYTDELSVVADNLVEEMGTREYVLRTVAG